MATLPENLPPRVGTTSRGQVPDSLLTVCDLARILRVHEKTIRRLIARQAIPCIRLGRRVRFDPQDVVRWVSARKEG